MVEAVSDVSKYFRIILESVWGCLEVSRTCLLVIRGFFRGCLKISGNEDFGAKKIGSADRFYTVIFCVVIIYNTVFMVHFLR